MRVTSSVAFGFVMFLALLTVEASAIQLVVDQQGGITSLSIDAQPPLYSAFHATDATVSDEELIEVGGSTTLVVYWNETVGQVTTPYYTFSFDGQHFLSARRASYVLKLHHANFDPLEGVPAVPASLAADPADELYVVQFFTQPLPEFHQEIGTLGGMVGTFMGAHANIVRMSAATRSQVDVLPYVRWVGELHPAHRLGDFVRANLESPSPLYPDHRYNIVLFDDDPDVKGMLVDRITNLGGTVHTFAATGLLLPATLTPDQLLSVVHWDEVLFVGLWESATTFMDNVRLLSGGQYIHNAGTFTGKGVTGQVMDNWLLASHDGFNRCVDGDRDGMSCYLDDDCDAGTCEESPILQGPQSEEANHGTYVYGTVFGDGTGTLPDAPIGAQGILPDGRGIFADFGELKDWGGSWLGRETVLCQLVADDCQQDCCDTEYCDPFCCEASCTLETCDPVGCAECCEPEVGCEGDNYCPYDAVFQTNSWGSQGFSEGYGWTAQNLDRILFKHDLLVCQAQGNSGLELPQPQVYEALAKNDVSVGGVYHNDNEDPTDDYWCAAGKATCASTGPAPDGRIKPDLSHFYDGVYTACYDQNGSLSPNPCDRGGYRSDFGGTSAATPITCGQFGLFFQMWQGELFNVCDGFNDGEGCGPSGNLEDTVFNTRPPIATAKAMMINTAEPYDFIGAEPTVDLTRTHQGWGVASVGKLYALALRDAFKRIVNETKPLDLLDIGNGSNIAEYTVSVAADTYALKATLVYADPEGSIVSERNAVNDLNLQVISPDDPPKEYWGNCGLREGNWSTECTAPNPPDPNDTDIPPAPVVDTVENVFVTDLSPGLWTIRVIADQIVPADSQVDFALVVSADFDCDGEGKSDADEISRSDRFDCNVNGIPDGCDITAGTSLDNSPIDGVPDECQVVPLVPPGPHHDARKNRYLSIDPSTNGPYPVALKVTLVDSDEYPDAIGRSWWVQEPQQSCVDCTDEDWFARLRPASEPHERLDPNMYFRPWNDFGVTSSNVLHIADCGIVPAAEYEVRACQLPFGETCSPPLTIGTILTPGARYYGDVVGTGTGDLPPLPGFTPPNGVVNVTDIQAYILTFQGPSVPSAHITWVDLRGDGPGSPPNYILNVADLQFIKFGLEGRTYAEGVQHLSPNDCPPEYCESAADCDDGVGCTDGTCVVGSCVHISNDAYCPDDDVWCNGQEYCHPVQDCTSTGNPCDPPDTCFEFYEDCSYQSSGPEGSGGLLGPGGGGPSAPLGGGTSVLFALVPSSGSIEAGETVNVEVFIDSVDDLMAYEASLEVTGGDTGELALTDVVIDHTRQDWVFAAASGVDKVGVVWRRAALASADGGVPVTGPAYLATFSYQASVDASGTFHVSIRTSQDILILNDSDGQPYETDPGIGASIEVTIECLTDPDCDDYNDCTIDTCVNYACVNDNAAQGTSCDDGLFCTPNDQCDGSGICVGSGIRCPRGQWCDELNDQCRFGPPQ